MYFLIAHFFLPLCEIFSGDTCSNNSFIVSVVQLSYVWIDHLIRVHPIIDRNCVHLSFLLLQKMLLCSLFTGLLTNVQEFLSCIPWPWILGHSTCASSTLLDTVRQFPEVFVPIYIPTSNMWESPLLHSLPHCAHYLFMQSTWLGDCFSQIIIFSILTLLDYSASADPLFWIKSYSISQGSSFQGQFTPIICWKIALSLSHERGCYSTVSWLHHYWHFGQFFIEMKYPRHFGMFGSISGCNPLDAIKMSFLQMWEPKIAPSVSKCLPGEKVAPSWEPQYYSITPYPDSGI